MNTLIEELLENMVANLKNSIGLDQISYHHSNNEMYDYDLTINGITFACEVKDYSVNTARLNVIINQLRNIKAHINKPLLLVVRHFALSSLTSESIYNEGINIIESSGNCRISQNPLFINISGKKTVLPKETKNMAFNPSGIKLIFYFLINQNNINKPYRQIKDETGLSLGTIKNVITSLSENNYIFTKSNKRFFQNKKQLLDEWQIHYNRVLKPKLLVNEMAFVNRNELSALMSQSLPQGMYWGGEGGAYILDHFLIPKQFDIYTEVPSVKLLLTKRFKTQPGGNIRVYKKFWDYGDGEHNQVAPKILIYADLMGCGDSRCIEAAQRLFNNGI